MQVCVPRQSRLMSTPGFLGGVSRGLGSACKPQRPFLMTDSPELLDNPSFQFLFHLILHYEGKNHYMLESLPPSSTKKLTELCTGQSRRM